MTNKLSTQSSLPQNPNKGVNYDGVKLNEIWLAGGCFWGVQAYFSRIYGVAKVTVGYANGDTKNPTYEDVCTKNTGHAEAIHVRYDPQKVDLITLLEYYFNIIDPTLKNRQGNDIGAQYRSGIYYRDLLDFEIIEKYVKEKQEKYTKPIVTEVLPLIEYSLAEEYHQNYLENHPNGYCHVDFSTLGYKESVKVDPARYKKPDHSVLKSNLTEEQYSVTQTNGTEQPFSNTYWNNHEVGLYVDIVTGEPMFTSKDKFDSGCGWPSFTKPVEGDVVSYKTDKSYGVTRKEVRSRVGDSHLGHVFEDGPVDKGGLRYCINSASLRFIPIDEIENEGYGDFISLFKE